MEEYYDAALTEVEKDSWGPNLKMRATPDAKKIIFFHEFKECYIAPDGHFALEIVIKAHATAAEITELSKKVLQSATTLTKEARWTNKLYAEGVRFDYSDTSLLRRINLLITDIDTCFKSDAMSELPSPSPPTTSTPLTAAPASLKSTSSAQIFSTCSPMSTSPPQATYHRVCSLRTTTSAQRSAHSSRRNGSASQPLSRLSSSSTPTTLKSRSSTMSPASSTTDHGEPSHGDHHCPGPSPSSSLSPSPR